MRQNRVKKLLTILFFLPLFSLAQNETNVGWITYDSAIQTTVDGLHFHQYTFRKTSAPRTDTSKRISIWEMSGEGEMGTDTNKLVVYGPHYWLKNGWDGSVTLNSGGKRYPVLISCISDQTAPYAEDNLVFMNTMLSLYHIFRPGAIHITGLSAGAWAWSTMINYQTGAALYDGMKNITSVLCLSGFATNALYPGDQNPPYQIGLPAWGYWAHHYNGRYLGLQGSSDGVGGIYNGQQNMLDSGYGAQAYFSYQNNSGGSHCCWNTLYDPSLKHFNSVTTPLGTYNVTGAQPNAQGSYLDGENLFTWEVMQGDTTAVTGAPLPTVSAGSNQTITLPTSSVTLSGSASANSPATSITGYLWTQLSGPNTGTFSSTTVTGPTFSSLIAGTYVLNLRATDNDGNQNNAQVTITVNSAVVNSCHAYYWDTTNISIALTNANYPTINPCDTIYIDPCATQAGYRSVAIKLTSSNPWKYSTLDSNRINLIFRNAAAYGTIKSNSGGNLFANSIDASNNLLIKGLKMADHTDPLFFSVTSTGYLHHIKFLNDTLQNMPGLWGSGPITTGLSNFTGGTDTINCNYDIWFRKCIFDSIGTPSSGGLTVMWLGGLNKNQVFVKTEVDSCQFNYAPSPSPAGPACFIHCQQCFFIKVHDNSFTNLGVVSIPLGHAASIFMQGSLYYVYHNFYHANFANCVRSISQATVPGMNSLFTTWDATYDGVSRFWGNILDSGRKYPFIEMQKDTIGLNGLTYCQAMRSPRVWNNTMYRGGYGANDGPYNVSTVDWYKVAYTSDTLEAHNNIQIGPPVDSTATTCGSQACNAFITQPNNGTPIYDTSGNQFYQLMTFATSGLADTVHFYPLLNGLMYNNGVAVPAWLTKDYYGKAVPISGRMPFNRNTGVDVGAVQYPATIPKNYIPVPVGWRPVIH